MQVSFGAGALFGRPAQAPATPIQFGALQGVTIDFSAAVKELQDGQHQYAIAYARGIEKIDCKAQSAQISARLFNQIFFNSSSGLHTGETKLIVDESHVVTANAATVAYSSYFLLDFGVAYSSNGVVLSNVSSNPAPGQYSCNETTGVYAFNATDNLAAVDISYTWHDDSNGQRVILVSEALCNAPQFIAVFTETFNGQQITLTFNACASDKLTMATKLEDFAIPEFDFAAYADASNSVGVYGQGGSSDWIASSAVTIWPNSYGMHTQGVVVFSNTKICCIGHSDVFTHPYIFATTSLDGGVTWSAPVGVGDDRQSGKLVWNGSFVCGTSINIFSSFMTNRSSNGTTWASISGGGVSNVSGIFLGSDGNGLLVTLQGRTTSLTSTNNGTSWTLHNAVLTDRSWQGMEWDADNQVFCLLGSMAIMATSPDGITWTEHVTPCELELGLMARGGGVSVALGTSHVAISTDAVTWTQVSLPALPAIYNATKIGVAYNDGLFCIAGNGSYCYTSADGSSWVLRKFDQPMPRSAAGGGSVNAIVAIPGSSSFLVAGGVNDGSNVTGVILTP